MRTVRLFPLFAASLLWIGAAGCGVGHEADAEGCTPQAIAAFDGLLAPIDTPVAAATICKECHASHYDLWQYGGHNRIACHICHGPPGDHVKEDIPVRPEMRLETRPLLCQSCHGYGKIPVLKNVPLVGGLEAHVRDVSRKHSVEIQTDNIGGSCTFCHDPHSLQ